MPKFLVLSNGNLLVGLDKSAQVRDLYYPYVGLENQTGGQYTHMIGVWTHSRFTWLSDPSWQIDINYQPDTLASKISAINTDMQVRLDFTDIVYNEKDIFIREINVTNLGDHPRLIKLFFHHQLVIHEIHKKDTSYFDPRLPAVIHYKGRPAFFITAESEGKFFEDYNTGLFYSDGQEGSHVDAQDGYLSKNPIEHGQVDSVIGLSLNTEPNQTKVVHYWLIAATSVRDLYDQNQFVIQRTPASLMKSSADFWRAWISRDTWDFANLPDKVITLFKRSLLIIRTHADNHGGIIASCDSDLLQYGRDNYSYIWPRDGSVSAIALDKTNDHTVAERFFQYCNDIIHPDGYFLHKYRPDQALGASWHPWVRGTTPQLPIQEDETALVIHALWQHYLLTRDLEFIESIYNSLIKKAAEFMVSYRDLSTGLPKESYNLWEEKYGVSTFTASSVYAALISASKFADLLGKTDSGQKYRQAADQIRDGILTHLYDGAKGYFYCLTNLNGEPGKIDPTVDMSAAYSIFRFGVLQPTDPRVTSSMSYSLFRLGLTTLIGGVARYEGDPYFRVDGSLPGNPWFISTLWLAQYYLTLAQKPEDLASVRRLLEWVAKHALPSGILSEQLNPHTGDQISAAPLTWSHAEFVITLLEYLDKLKSLSR